MKRRIVYIFIMYAVLFLTYSAFGSTGDKYRLLQSNSVDPAFQSLIFSSRTSYWVWANCISGTKPQNLPGLWFYPGYSNYTEPLSGIPLLYTDGILWGGKVHDNKKPELRVSGSVYSAGVQPGAIKNGTSFNISENKKIWTTLNEGYFDNYRNLMAQLIYDKSEEEVWGKDELTEPFIIRSFDKNSWPWQFGAPFCDFNKNSLFDETEKAGILNADETVWTVCNDLDSNLCEQEFHCPSTGMEIQQTAWIYKTYYGLPITETIFKKYRFIYKGGPGTPVSAKIDSMFITIFCDPDIGEYANDCAGCDTSLDLMFAYNAEPSEPSFDKFNIAPMSVGYYLIQGPVVKTNNPSDIAHFCGREIKGYKNLGITAFNCMENDPLSDPENRWPFSDTWYKYMQGINYLTGSPFKTADGSPTKFPYSGDPIMHSGDLDPFFNYGGSDRRIMFHTGPFTMALADTQEIIIAISVGSGPDYLQSVEQLKYIAKNARVFADNNFVFYPEHPPSPEVQGSSVKDGIVITWTPNPENWQKDKYVFEGYNIYYKIDEYPYKKRIATFDLKNGISNISQEYYDYENGLVSLKTVQHGTDSGLQHFYKIGKYDRFLDQQHLIEGHTYSFGVSSYARSTDPEKFVSSTESPVTWVNVSYEPLPIGTRIQNQFGDTLTVSHINGTGSGQVHVKIINPLNLTGDDYSVSFFKNQSDELYWILTDLTEGSTLLDFQTNFSGDLNYSVTHGFMAIPNGPPCIKAFVQVADENGSLAPDKYDEKGSKYNGNWVWNDLPAGEEEYYASFINMNTPQWESAIKNANYHDFELRFNDSENFVIDSQNHIANIPFTIYDISIDSWDDQFDDIPCIIKSRLKQTETGSYLFGFTSHSTDNNMPCTEPVEIIRPESQDIYNDFILDISDGKIDSEEWSKKSQTVLKGLILVNESKQFPADGTVLRIILNKPFSTEDVFRFSTSEPLYSIENAKQDAKKITIVPNPYYGSIQETQTWKQTDNTDPRYVTFHHLPQQAVIHIFDLAGNHVTTLEKNDNTQYLKWDMTNNYGMLIANGLYIIRIELPEIGAVKILKFLVCHY